MISNAGIHQSDRIGRGRRRAFIPPHPTPTNPWVERGGFYRSIQPAGALHTHTRTSATRSGARWRPPPRRTRARSPGRRTSRQRPLRCGARPPASAWSPPWLFLVWFGGGGTNWLTTLMRGCTTGLDHLSSCASCRRRRSFKTPSRSRLIEISGARPAIFLAPLDRFGRTKVHHFVDIDPTDLPSTTNSDQIDSRSPRPLRSRSPRHRQQRQQRIHTAKVIGQQRTAGSPRTRFHGFGTPPPAGSSSVSAVSVGAAGSG